MATNVAEEGVGAFSLRRSFGVSFTFHSKYHDNTINSVEQNILNLDRIELKNIKTHSHKHTINSQNTDIAIHSIEHRSKNG